jgi:hypothetical protein
MRSHGMPAPPVRHDSQCRMSYSILSMMTLIASVIPGKDVPCDLGRAFLGTAQRSTCHFLGPTARHKHSMKMEQYASNLLDFLKKGN